MRFLIRTLFIWLLVLAVPVQGAAAATMAFCGPGHHGDAATAQTLEAPAMGHVHPVGAAAAAHAHAVADAVAVAVADAHAVAVADEHAAAVTDAVAPATLGHTDTHKCSACASCCSLGAIVNSLLAVPAPVFGPTVFAAVVASVTAFAAEGPDRPPRHVSA